MPWGETIADYVRSRQARKYSERDAMWAKLMDAASMGSDIWKTLSGRKYGTSEREATQVYGTNERLGTQAFSAGQAAQTRGFQAEQGLYDKAFNAGQNDLDRALQRELEKARMERDASERAKQTMSALAAWTQRAYELALSNPLFITPEGQFNMGKKEELRQFLYSQVDKYPGLTDKEIAWAKGSFDGYVDKWGTVATVKQDGSKDYIAAFKKIAATVKNITSPPYDTGGMTTKSWAGPESALEAELSGMIPQLQGEDKEYAQAALNMSANPGKLGKANYDMLYKVAQYLKTKLKQFLPQGSQINTSGYGNPANPLLK
jgi:hypothetical protein